MRASVGGAFCAFVFLPQLLAAQAPSDASFNPDSLTVCHMVMASRRGDTVTIASVCAPARWWRMRLLWPVNSPARPDSGVARKEESKP